MHLSSSIRVVAETQSVKEDLRQQPLLLVTDSLTESAMKIGQADLALEIIEITAWNEGPESSVETKVITV